MRKILLVAGLFGTLLAVSANATITQGVFYGDVYAANGTVNGLDLSSLIGLPITGKFSYDSQALPLVEGGSGTCCSIFSASPSSNPIVISDTVGGNTYTTSGTAVSSLDVATNIDANHPDNFFRLEAQNGIGEIVFGLTNHLGAPFLSESSDAGTANFVYFSNPATGEDIFTGGSVIEFSIYYAAAGPVESVPEPATLSLVGFGLAVLGFIRRRKAD